jgi:hypothetical protein
MSSKTTLPLLLMLLTGCQQARSFLHMNSDSPAPFLGFELAVDANDVQQRQLREDSSSTMPNSTIAVSSSFASDQESSGKEALRSADGTANVQASFVATSDSGPQNGTLKYSLPTVDLLNGGVEAEEVDAIINRFPG